MMTTRSPDIATGPGRWSGLHPLLFAAYPVLFLWSQNLGEASPLEVALPLLILVGGAAVLTWSLGRLLGDRRRAALIVSPLLVGLLMYGHVEQLLSTLDVPGLVLQAASVAMVVVGALAAVRLGSRRVAAVDRALGWMAGILVTVTLVLIVPFQVDVALSGQSGSTAPAASSGTLAASAAPATGFEPQPGAARRDVYWLIFDRYGSDRAFELLHGIENDLTPWLRERGFTVLDDSHANYVRTATSMATTLSMQHLVDMAGLPGPASTNLRPVHARLQSSPVARQFKELGYRYIHIGSRWGPNAEDAAADVNLFLPAPSDFATALIDASAIPALLRRVGLDPFGPRERQYRHNEYSLDALAGAIDEPGPKFVTAHVLLPHPPMVYDRDGRYMTRLEQWGLSDTELLERQLAYTNTRLRAILGDLLALPEAERPVIILQADEGPESAHYRETRATTFDWATASDEDLEIKFGIMNAWYVPDGEDLGLYPSMTSINTFPVLFSRYFGLDYPLLPDTVYAARRYDLQYDVTDVTGRLPSLR